MPDYNTQVHGTPTVVRDPKTIKRRHWAVALWFMLIWLLTGFAFFFTMSAGAAVGLSLLGLGTGFVAAWHLAISASPLRRNVYTFAYFCMTIGFGTNLIFMFDMFMELITGGYAGDLGLILLLSPLPIGPAFALDSPLPFAVPLLGVVCWLIAKYPLHEPTPD